MWFTTRWTIFEFVTASRICGYAMIYSNVHVDTVNGSIGHFKFPKLVLAHKIILDEVDTFT